MDTSTILSCVITFIVAGILCGLIAFKLGVSYRKKVSEAEIGSAEEQAKKIINDAVKSSENKKKEILIEAKDESHKLRLESDKDIKERRAEVTRQERRIQQKEESLDKKMDNLEKKDENLQQKLKNIETEKLEIEEIKKQQFKKLETIVGLTAEQAKEQLIASLENELIHEKALKITQYEQNLKDEADQKARNLISLAISRCASEHVSEATVSVVTLPNDEMKGRIIGREGRNIRALETLTGVDLIIDDTPEAITLSCFDPVRREIAKTALEKLILDGRIHPTKIEECVEKAEKEVNNFIKSEGERAIMELGIHGVHPELIKIIGRLTFRTSYGQNILNHSIEVAKIAGNLASELGGNVNLAKRGGLLHDIGKALTHEIEGSHVEIGVDLCKKYKENQQVLHAIEAHHGDIEPKTTTAFLVQAADAISASRPAARRENLDNYIKRLQKLEEISCSFEGVEKCFAVQAGREVRIMVSPEQVSDEKMVIIARNIVKRIEDEMQYPGQIKVHVIRENRSIEFAK